MCACELKSPLAYLPPVLRFFLPLFFLAAALLLLAVAAFLFFLAASL